MYNVGLLLVAGVLTQDDMERWKREGLSRDDMFMAMLILGRNPMFGSRLGPAFQMMMMGLDTITAKNPNTYRFLDRAMAAAMPLPLLAAKSLFHKSLNVGMDMKNSLTGKSQGFDWTEAADVALRAVPVAGDTLLRWWLTSTLGNQLDKIEPGRYTGGAGSTSSKGTRGEHFSPYTMTNENIDSFFGSLSDHGYELLREILPEATDRWMRNNTPMHNTLPAPLSLPSPVSELPAPEGAPQAAAPTGAPTGPPAAPTGPPQVSAEPQIPSVAEVPTEEPRAHEPAPPPEELI